MIVMKEEKIGIIKHFFNNINVAAVKIINGELKIGDTIHIVGAHTDFKQEILSMQIQKDPIKLVKTGDEVGILVLNKVHENDIVYKFTEE